MHYQLCQDSALQRLSSVPRPPTALASTTKMSYANGNAAAQLNDESDVEEEALVNDYREQVQYDDGMSELDRATSSAAGAPDIQAQLAAAATPLEYQATLETKFASYDNYCSLFHYILNSDGPVDLEVPNVSARFNSMSFSPTTHPLTSTTGHGTSSTNSSTNLNPSAATATA